MALQAKNVLAIYVKLVWLWNNNYWRLSIDFHKKIWRYIQENKNFTVSDGPQSKT